MSSPAIASTDPLNSIFAIKKRIEEVDAISLHLDTSFNSHIQEARSLRAKLEVIQNNIHSVQMEKESLLVQKHKLEIEQEIIKKDLRAVLLSFLESRKHYPFHCTEQLLPVVRELGVVVLDKEGKPLGEYKLVKKIQTILRRECGPGGHVKRVLGIDGDRGGFYQWTDIPNPYPSKEKKAPQPLHVVQKEEESSSIVPLGTTLQQPTTEFEWWWASQVVEEMKNGKVYTKQDLEDDYCNTARTNGVEFKNHRHLAVDIIEEAAQRGAPIDLWGRKLTATSATSWDFRYQYAGTPPPSPFESWQMRLPAPRPRVPPMKRPAPKK